MKMATAQDWAKLDRDHPQLARGRRHFLAQFMEGAGDRAAPAIQRMAKAMHSTINDPRMRAEVEATETLRAALIDTVVMAMLLLERIEIHEGHADALLFEIGAPDFPEDHLAGLNCSAAEDFARRDQTVH